MLGSQKIIAFVATRDLARAKGCRPFPRRARAASWKGAPISRMTISYERRRSSPPPPDAVCSSRSEESMGCFPMIFLQGAYCADFTRLAVPFLDREGATSLKTQPAQSTRALTKVAVDVADERPAVVCIGGPTRTRRLRPVCREAAHASRPDGRD